MGYEKVILSTEKCGCVNYYIEHDFFVGNKEKGIDKCNKCLGIVNKCLNCNKNIKDGYKICYSCNLLEKKNISNKCVNCDKNIKDGYKVCYSCNLKKKSNKVNNN